MTFPLVLIGVEAFVGLIVFLALPHGHSAAIAEQLPDAIVCASLAQLRNPALALIPADRVLSAENGWLSPLPPEGASAIVHRTTEFAPQMAQSQGVHAPKLLETGVVDRIIAEHRIARGRRGTRRRTPPRW